MGSEGQFCSGPSFPGPSFSALKKAAAGWLREDSSSSRLASSCGPSSASRLAGLLLRVTAGFQEQHKGKLSGLWRPRIRTCNTFSLTTVYGSPQVTDQLSFKRWEKICHSLGEELQSTVAILQSLTSPLGTAQHLMPSIQCS